MSVNKVILVGNLGGDPEVRYTANNQVVCTFNIATTEKWASKNGQPGERTEWHRIVVWGKLAEICKEYLAKGRQVFVEGRIQSRQWDDKEGKKRTTTEIIAQNVQFLSSPQGRSAKSAQSTVEQPDAGQPDFSPQTASAQSTPPVGDDDIPF